MGTNRGLGSRIQDALKTGNHDAIALGHGAPLRARSPARSISPYFTVIRSTQKNIQLIHRPPDVVPSPPEAASVGMDLASE
jgi:hypothetical protein